MRARLLIPVLAAMTLPCAAAPSALAADLTVSGDRILYFADAGEDNDLVVTQVGSNYVFTDTAPIQGIPPCTDGPAATCPVAGISHIEIDLANLDDEAVLVPATPSTMRGGLGSDTLTGGDAGDLLQGQEDNDTLNGEGGEDTLEGEELNSGDVGDNDLDGGAGADDLTGGDGIDIVQGGTGDDRLSGLADEDELDGGEGSDFVSGGDENDLMQGGDGNDVIGDDSVSVFGLPPERGDDDLEGGNGDDVLRPGLGPTQGISDNDTHNGGPGFDSVVFDKRTARVQVTLDQAPNDGGTGESDNVTGDVERLVGGQAGDLLVGGLAGDTIDGFRGPDTIQGGGGADTLDGGADDAEGDNLSGGDGGDLLRGSAGDDALNGDAGTDTLAGDAGADTVQGGAEADLITGGAGTDNLAGGAGDDNVDGAAPVLLGADGGDSLRGEQGNDSLRGGAANDNLDGGDGADDLRGEAGSDAAEYGGADQAVRVSLDGRANDGERAERDNVRTDVENVDGGGVQDTFTGSRGRNRLDGGAGEDFVDGRRGADQLLGGAAVDVVRSRDGRTRDTVRCGRGKDFAIVGREDRVVGDCEAFDNGIRRVPRAGVAFMLRPLRGSNGFGPPGMRRTVPLQDRLRVPIASQVDARKGSVGLVLSRRGRSRPGGRFSGGLFQVLQGRSRRAVAELRLRGGDFGVCRTGRGAGRAAAPAQRRRLIRRLRSRARGPFKAAGRHSAGTARGTTFTVEDRCDGTLTRVQSGVVRVRDFRRRRTVTVRAGKSYLARARR